MGFVTKIEAFVISEIKSTIMDRLHMGGTFLQQAQTVKVGGLPVAIKQGGALGALGGALSDLTAVVQAAGDIASLVQNPMSLVEGAINSQISGLSSQLGDITSKLSGGQLSSLTNAISNVSGALSDFQTHTQLLSGQATAVLDTVPDFKKLVDTGNNLANIGTDSVNGFVQNTASALYSDEKLANIRDTMQVVVADKLNIIKTLDPNTDSALISTLVSEAAALLNNHTTTMTDIVAADVHNFNEAGNNITASTSVIGIAEQYANTDSVSYTLMTRVGKPSTLETFNTAISAARTE